MFTQNLKEIFRVRDFPLGFLYKNRTTKVGLIFIYCLLFFSLGGMLKSFAQTTTEEESHLFWPPPPANPRIYFVKNISGSNELNIKKTFLERMKEIFTGKKVVFFARPMALAISEDGILYIADAGAGKVFAYHPNEKKIKSIAQVDKHINFVSPIGIGVSSEGIIFVSDSSLGKIFAINEKGKSQFVLGEKEGIKRPTGLFVRGEKVYVVDTDGCQIFVFDVRGNLLSRFGKRGAADGEFNYPTNIFVGDEGLIYVSDTLNSRIQIFDLQGGFKKSIGSAGDSSGHFSRPKGVAVDSFGHIYVVDALFDNVQIFDYEGKYLMNFGDRGSLDGEFWLPAGITIDKNNYIYVADSYNKRISAFRYVGGQ